MPKYIHKVKTLPEIPRDYYERWDSSTSHRMQFNTDEATGDMTEWYGQCGNVELDNRQGTGYPTWGGPETGGVYFDGNHSLVDISSHLTDQSKSVFVVGKMVGTNQYHSFFHGPGMHSLIGIRTTAASTMEHRAYHATPGWRALVTSTNDIADGSTIMAVGATFNRTAADTYTVNTYFGANSKSTNTGQLIAQVGYIGFGYSAAQYGEQYVYEAILYDREVSDAEAQTILNYLSNKWGAQNEDSASSVIASGSTETNYITDRVDTVGEPILTHPGRQDGEFAVNQIRDRSPYSKAYTYHKWGSNLKFVFDASNTNGMTFSGSDVTTWVDPVTGTFTLDDTYTAATPPRRERHQGKWALYFDGVNDYLRSSTTHTWSTTATDEIITWGVFKMDDPGASAIQYILTHGGSDHLVGTNNGFYGDLEAAKNPAVVRARAASGTTYAPLSVLDCRDDIYIFIKKTTINASDADFDVWHRGLKVFTTAAGTKPGGTPRVTMGASSTKTLHGKGWVFEMGGVQVSGGGIADAEIEDFAMYLAQKYDKSFMPDSTPADIGLTATTATVAQTDCYRWFRSDVGLSEQGWSMHPLIERHHTPGLDYTLEHKYTDLPPVVNALGRKVQEHDEDVGSGTIMIGAGYNFAETTDFPASGSGWGQDGATWGGLAFNDYTNTTTASARFFSHGGTNQFMQWKTGSFGAANYIGGRAISGGGNNDEWNLFLSKLAFDDDGTGTADGDPHEWTHKNLYSEQNSDNSTVTAPGTHKSSTGGEVGPGQPSDGKVVEMWGWKHALHDFHHRSMAMYVSERYPYMNQQHLLPGIMPHHAHPDMTAHWLFNNGSQDVTGNKGAFNTGTFTAGTFDASMFPPTAHDHTAETAGFSYTAQDTDLDTLGAFTWAAAVFVDSSAADHDLIRSETPAGGATAADNQRLHLRLELDNTVRYQHQSGTKVNQTYTTTATYPDDEWFYIAVTRAADGTSGRVMIGDTVEEFSGLTAPENGSSARFEMLERWDGPDFDGYIFSAVFFNKEMSEAELRKMKAQVFPFQTTA